MKINFYLDSNLVSVEAVEKKLCQDTTDEERHRSKLYAQNTQLKSVRNILQPMVSGH